VKTGNKCRLHVFSCGSSFSYCYVNGLLSAQGCAKNAIDFRVDIVKDGNHLQKQVFAEQINLVIKQYPIAALTGSLVSMVVAFVMHPRIPDALIGAWLIALNTSLLIGYINVRQYRARAAAHDLKVWYWRYIGVVSLNACCWSAIGIFLTFDLHVFQELFIIISLVGVAASALVLAVPLLPAYLIYVSLPMSSAVLWVFMQADDTKRSLGVLGVLFLFLLVIAGRGLNQQLVNTLRLRFKNIDLANEVKQLNENLENRVKEKTEALFKSEERFDLAMQGANDGLWDWNITESTSYFSPRWKAMLGWEEFEIGDSPKEWRSRIHKDDRRKVLSVMRSHLDGLTKSYESIHRIRHKNGDYLWVLDRGCAQFDDNGKPYRMVGTQVDITEQKKLEEKFKSANIKLKHEAKERLLAQSELAHLAKHDPLTGLPNRIFFYEKLQDAIMRGEMEGDAIAVLLVDLDNFKHVNDTLGHPAGDKLLVDVSKRLTAIVNKNYFLSRFGGDEFLVILEGCSDTFIVDAYAKEIIELISKPFYLEDQEIRIGSSIGITLFPDHGKEPDILIRDADIAMYHAKDEGRNTYRYFTEEMDQKISNRARLRNLLHGVIERDELEVYYQPQVNIETGEISGIEALLRWNAEEGNSVGPEQFIPLLEEIGLISQVGRWVLRQACMHAIRLQNKGLKNFKMSVNASPRQFLHEGLVKDIEAILNETGLDAKCLEIEITENIFMQDLDLVRQSLFELKELGVSITLDDFGTGYSSLGYLKRFPINGVKIDKVFISDLLKNNDSRELVTAIIAMAKGLNMTTLVAEGVESDTQLKVLRRAGCTSYQGYLFSQALPYEHLEQRLFPSNKLKLV